MGAMNKLLMQHAEDSVYASLVNRARFDGITNTVKDMQGLNALGDGSRQRAQESDLLAGKTQSPGPELLEAGAAWHAGTRSTSRQFRAEKPSSLPVTSRL